jgi:hypothetical protein
LQIDGRLYHLAPASLSCWRSHETAGPLRSAGITPPPRYHGPVLHPLAFGRFPDGLPVIRPTLLHRLSRWDEEGFTSCLTRPCHRAVATTPPEQFASSTNLRRSVLPSPDDSGLGLWGYTLSGPPMRSLPLRPGDSLTIPWMAFVDGLQIIRFPSCLPSKLRGLGSCPGGFVSH